MTENSDPGCFGSEIETPNIDALAARQIIRDHARAISETGGLIGLWHFFPSLERYVGGLK